MTRRGPAVPTRLLAIAVLVACSTGLSAYLKLGSESDAGLVPLKWTTMPVRYAINSRSAPGVSAQALQQSAASAFREWSDVADVDISSDFVGFVSNEPFDADGISVIGFRARPDLDRTLGATTFRADAVSGAILEADVFLNTEVDWSTNDAGEAGRFDVESILLHELGHLLGLGHSALGETELEGDGRRRVLGKAAIMFPLAFPAGNPRDRDLRRDDVAGLYDIYVPSASQKLGSISGRVRLNGAGVYGAHVTAFNPKTGDLVGTFTLNQSGSFVVAGLDAGLYVVRAEPLDDADLDSFFEDDAVTTIDFRPAFASNLVAVPAGGTSDRVDIEVAGK
jgi:hypothetical protein